ncbi:MAG TPA: hypothetical protein VFZ58_02950 [Candidatus Saccharimonadales bacterium]
MDRPTKSQQQLLEFIEAFIKQHTFGPSYREIMRALDYKSVSTVATHVDGLVARGLLKKRGRSARSLEVVEQRQAFVVGVVSDYEKWLSEKLKKHALSDNSSKVTLETLARSFHLLGLSELQKMAEAYAAEKD